jgi:hypothetical protein
MDQIGPNSYVAVYDLKNFEKGPRMGIIDVTDSSFIVNPVTIKNWDEFGQIASDLEAVCKIPGKTNEILIAESGNWQGNNGRVFHLLLDKKKFEATIKGVFQLPVNKINDFDKVGDQTEGIICLQDQNDYYLILGERGGSKNFEEGLITWCKINFDEYHLYYSTVGKQGLKIPEPSGFSLSVGARAITDFHIDEYNILWASSTTDAGDLGPFSSIIYPIGLIEIKIGGLRIKRTIDYSHIKIPGFKIEALSASPSLNLEKEFSFGSEDEILGGSWRIIAKPLKK